MGRLRPHSPAPPRAGDPAASAFPSPAGCGTLARVPEVQVSRRAGVRLATISIGLALALLGAGNATAANPTLYVHYATNCTFTIVGDNGAAVTSIPPGSYQILVTSPEPFAAPDLSGETDPNVACGGALSFRLTGAGVNIHTTLEDGDAVSDQLSATFQAGSYVAQEDRRPTFTRFVLTVAGGAATTGGGSAGGSSGSSGSGSTGSSGTKSAATSKLAVRGKLSGGVSTAGKLTLAGKGKNRPSAKGGRLQAPRRH